MRYWKEAHPYLGLIVAIVAAHYATWSPAEAQDRVQAPAVPALRGTLTTLTSLSITSVPERRHASAWHINAEALDIIRESEGLRLAPYHLAGQVLIGYGHAVEGADELADVPAITRAEANRLLKADIAICEDAVGNAVTTRVTQNEFSAMVALCYNVGIGTFARSSIVRHVNAGEPLRAANAFLRYNQAVIDNEKQEVSVLTERRQRERELFLS